jgi:hypothetical protein
MLRPSTFLIVLLMVLPVAALGDKGKNKSRNKRTECSRSIGEERAARLVDQCLKVTPATHPPCNASNPCELIIDEIVRGCAILREGSDPGLPGFCSKYAKVR